MSIWKKNGNGLVSYSTPDYSFKSVDGKNGKTYKKPILLNASQTAEPGQPDLPSSSTFLAIDPQKTYSVTVNIISSQITENIEIAPKGSWDNNTDEDSFSEG